jgi:hypothetical protein
MDEWMAKATTFLDRAFSWTQIVCCPCSLCQNLRCLENKRTITIHLCKNDFMPVLVVLKPNRIIRKHTDANYSSFHLRVFLGLSNP